MGYKEKYKLTKKWWHQKKDSYIFDSEWLSAFEKIDPRLKKPEKEIDGEPNLGKMGIVFWHEEDGKNIVPVGVIYNDGKESLFAYHPEFSEDPNTQPIAYTLPKSPLLHKQSDVDNEGIIPFFDNLVSEGWLGYLQQNVVNQVVSPTHAIERSKYYGFEHFKTNNHFNPNERFERLLMFGRGFHGAVSVIDVNASDKILEEEQKLFEGSLKAHATIGGGAPKALAVKHGGVFKIAAREDTSTHLVKLSEGNNIHISPLNGMKNEYLNIIATHELLPSDETAKGELAMYYADQATPTIGLFIERFDRNPQGGRIQFEEALQIKGEPANQMNSQAYKDLLAIGTQLGIANSGELLFKRILSQWMLGNADGHFKNFAVWKRDGKWKWTPNYDLETTDNIIQYGDACSGIPQKIGNQNYDLYKVTSKVLFILAKDLGLNADQAKTCIDQVRERLEPLAVTINQNENSPFITDEDKRAFFVRLEARCKRLFAGLDVAYEQAKKEESKIALT